MNYSKLMLFLCWHRSLSPRARSPRRRSLSPRPRSYSRSPPPYRGRDEVPYTNGYSLVSFIIMLLSARLINLEDLPMLACSFCLV